MCANVDEQTMLRTSNKHVTASCLVIVISSSDLHQLMSDDDRIQQLTRISFYICLVEWRRHRLQRHQLRGTARGVPPEAKAEVNCHLLPQYLR